MTQPVPRPCSSVYSNNFSLEDLVVRVDESVKATQRETIERLENENECFRSELTKHRATYSDSWDILMELFCESFDLALVLQVAVVEFMDRRFAAERCWLASLGIGESVVGDSF